MRSIRDGHKVLRGSAETRNGGDVRQDGRRLELVADGRALGRRRTEGRRGDAEAEFGAGTARAEVSGGQATGCTSHLAGQEEHGGQESG